MIILIIRRCVVWSFFFISSIIAHVPEAWNLGLSLSGHFGDVNSCLWLVNVNAVLVPQNYHSDSSHAQRGCNAILCIHNFPLRRPPPPAACATCYARFRKKGLITTIAVNCTMFKSLHVVGGGLQSASVLKARTPHSRTIPTTPSSL